MQAAEAWVIEYYLEEDDSSPVGEFLDSLDQKTLARFRWSLEQLQVRNITAGPPLVRHLEGDLWELREESSTNIYRIIYFFFTGRRIVLLHGFQKKTQRTKNKELKIARLRYRIFLQHEGRG